uniref:Uncharacterized protein n=1 Tax=Thermocrinis ruber TaxID=75906 RepID=A0A7C5X016_9AQUI
MDDRELIKRIMEEVKDEKLREELLALVVEKNKKEDATKQEEEKPIDYVAKQEILFGATEGVAKVGWWISYIISIVLMLVGSLGPLGILAYLLNPNGEWSKDSVPGMILSSVMFIIGLGGFLSLRSGKKEYEKLKRKRAN